MSDLTKAYEVLADPVRRPKYDRRRVAYTQSFAARFNGTPKYASPALAPDDLRSAAANRGKYRVAFFALMIVVVVLSTFNLVHYSTRLKGWLGTTMPTEPTPVRATARAATDAPVAGAAGAKLDDMPQAASSTNTRSLPISQSSACCRGIGCVQTATAGAPGWRSRRCHRDGVGERVRKRPGATTDRRRTSFCRCAAHRFPR